MRPGEQLVGVHRVDHARFVDAALLCPRAPVDLPVELPRRVCVSVDGESTADLDRQAQQSARWIESLRPAVDLDRDVMLFAPSEDFLGVELRFWSRVPALSPDQ